MILIWTGIIKNYSDIAIIVDSNITSHIQEVHRVIYHIICQTVESEMENYSEKT